jgi:Rap1a immunity proteins
MKRFCILTVTMLVLAVSHAHAQAPNAAAILKSCGTSPPGSNDYENCYSYINGVVSGVLVDQAARDQGRAICFPDHLVTDQVRQEVSAYLKAHPTILKADGNSVMKAALLALYPCKK